MLKLVFTLIIILSISCRPAEKDNSLSSTETQQQTVSQKETKLDNALNFINGYVKNSNNSTDKKAITDWINSNNLTTKEFKFELNKILNDAYKKEPEIGLDFDPILDAQDYPEKGFEIESFDEKTNYLIVRGKDWADFKLTIKIVEENGSWLVDGCGIININNNKKAER